MVLGGVMSPIKSSLFGEIVTLAPESQMMGNVASEGKELRNRLGAWRATFIDG